MDMSRSFENDMYYSATHLNFTSECVDVPHQLIGLEVQIKTFWPESLRIAQRFYLGNQTTMQGKRSMIS
jgi:hypothetical protein